MKHIILDTNVLINFPEVLSFRKKDAKLLVPRDVIEEILKLEHHRSKDLLDLINKAHEKGFIAITDTHLPQIKISATPAVGYVDFVILGYCRFLQENGNDVVLVTDDRRLHIAAKSSDINIFSSADLFNYYATNSTNSLEIKGAATKIENKERWSILLNIVITILFLIGAILLIRNFEEYIDNLTNVIWIILLILFGFLLFEIREKRRQLYGFMEVGFGMLTIIIIFYPDLILSNFDFYLKICAGLYVIVRGLDNLYKGSEKRRLGTVLKKLFRFK